MQDGEKVSVTIIVACRNEIRHVRNFLNSVTQQNTTDIDLEILIADGMSADGTREILEEYQGKCAILRVIENPKKIVSTGLNLAIREARGEIIVRMDAHMEYAPNYVRTCVQVIKETNAENVGGPALTRAEGYMAKAIACGFHSKFASGGARFHDPSYEGYVDTVTYGCWKKATLLRLGLFDEQIYRSQDNELNMRIVSSGGRIWQSPRIISWYRPRTTLSALFRQHFQYGFWKVALVRKHRRLPSWRNLVPCASLLIGFLLLLVALATGMNGSVRVANEFLVGFLAMAGMYIVISLGFASVSAARNGWRFFPILPIVFGTYHLAYALGFLLAIAYQPVTWDRTSYMQKILTAVTR